MMLVIYISVPVAYFVRGRGQNIYRLEYDLLYDQCILYFLRIVEFVSKSSWLTCTNLQYIMLLPQPCISQYVAF